MKTSKLCGAALVAALSLTWLANTSYAQTGVYFAGTDAGSNNVSGDRNAFVGYQAGFTNIAGDDNSFVGYQAGYSSTGSYNTFIGRQAGSANTSANSNSFLGAYAGGLNITGFANSFLGAFSGRNNLTGDSNSFVGCSSGYYNTTGSYNSFLGFESGFQNIAGGSNSFIGYQSGRNNTNGNYNSYMGHQAGFANTIGFSNSFLGYQSGYNTTGSMNSFLGVQSGYSNIGGHYNAYLGNGAGYLNVSGWSNVAVGAFSSYNNLGSDNTFIGYNANTPVGAIFTNSAAIGSKAYVSAANSMVLGSINGINGATANVNVGIGTTAPAYRLQLGSGDAAKPGTSTWVIASDRRLKQDISSFTDGLEVLKQVKPVWFRYNGEAGLPQDKKYVGVIAQEMQQVAPYTIGQFTHQDTTGKATQYLDYDANALTYILVNSVQEQQKQLQEKDAQIGELKGLLSALEQKMNNELAALKTLLHKQPTVANAEGDAAQLWQNEPNPRMALP